MERMIRSCYEMFDDMDDTDVYWFMKRMFNLHHKNTGGVDKLKEMFLNTLDKEDNEIYK